MEEQAGEQLQQDQEEFFGTQGTMEDGVQDQETRLTGPQGKDPHQQEGATLQVKKTRRRMMPGNQVKTSSGVVFGNGQKLKAKFIGDRKGTMVQKN